MIAIKYFGEVDEATKEEKESVLKSCENAQELWDNGVHSWLIWLVTQETVLTKKERLLFVCWCIRQVWAVLEDERSEQCVIIAEKYANGEATEEELQLAKLNANIATREAFDVVYEAFKVDSKGHPIAINYEYYICATAIARNAATILDDINIIIHNVDRALIAMNDSMMNFDNDYDVICDFKKKQMKYLRENCTPNFERITHV